jgi:lipid A 3-O-deacylase
MPNTRTEANWRQGALTLLLGNLLAIGCVALDQPLQAQPSPGDPQALIAAPPKPAEAPFWALESRWTAGFQLSYGLENGIPRNISHVNMIIAAPQIGWAAWDSPHSRLPMNRFEIISEGVLGSAYHPGGYLLGDTLMFRFDFKPVRRAVPYFDAGIAALHTSLDNQAPEISGHTQFLSQGGAGIQYFIHPGRAFVFEYRYFHMSNAGIQEPNHGFNGNMLSIGLRWFLRRHTAIQ